MRIVHAANFQYKNHGQAFGNQDQKLQHGFIKNGHFSYLFPVNDIARQLSWRNSKNGGAQRMNASFVETCKKVQPDVLVLGHGQLLTRDSIEQVRLALPDLKILQWFVDPMLYPRVYQFIHDRLDLLDAVYLTTGGEHLAQFQTDSCEAHFFPNVVHSDIEKYRAFESTEFQHDLIFVGNDAKDPARRELLSQLDSKLSKKFDLGIYGSLGRPGIHGKERDTLFQNSKASLNLTRHSPMKWYSSDRIAQLLGNGLLTCTHTDADLHEIYGSDTLITYSTPEELTEKLDHSFASGEWKTIARNGWEKVHSEHSATLISAQMLNRL